MPQLIRTGSFVFGVGPVEQIFVVFLMAVLKKKIANYPVQRLFIQVLTVYNKEWISYENMSNALVLVACFRFLTKRISISKVNIFLLVITL